MLNSQSNLDCKTTVSVNTAYSYDPDGYGLQTQSVTQNLLGTTVQGSATIINQFDNNPTGGGGNYYIGRPKQVNTSVTVYPGLPETDTRTSEEKYFYTRFDLTSTEKKGHQTDAILTEMTYNDVGSLLTKKVSVPTANPAPAPRLIIDEYEPTKRFVKKKTDHQGFITLLEYNALGLVTKSTDYMGVVNDFNFDAWGKLNWSITTGASITPRSVLYTYIKNADGGYSVEQNSIGTNEMSKTVYDVLGRVIKNSTKGFANNSIVSKTIEYDGLGRKIKESEPYFTSPSRYTNYFYDYLHRPIKVEQPTGRIQTFDYTQGLKTTVVDNGKNTSVRMDANGNKVETADPGGTINYSYYATGELKKTVYEEHEINIGINGWGNKTSMSDPNTGIYTYDYDAFGQLKIENTPTGSTKLKYDDFGKLIHKEVTGEGADFNIDYGYNNFAQLETERSETSGHALIDTFTHVYDAMHRISSTTETNQNLEHTKLITYDVYGRASVETNTTNEKSAANVTAIVKYQYNYNGYNGVMDKLTNPQDNTSFWQLDSANEKMQTLTAHLGNGVNITNQYQDFYLTSQRETKAGSDVLYDIYNFDHVSGNLKERTNAALRLTTEKFAYDDLKLDRLVSWTDLTSTNASADYNTYDLKGRILVNNKLGSYNYDTTAGSPIYQRTGIRLNDLGMPYFGALGGNQTVSYTMFKSPISINESNKGKIDFEYNSHLSRTKMSYDYGVISPATANDFRKSKLYTDDGAAEIIYDRATQSVKIRTFIGGDAYSAVAYSEKVVYQNNGTNGEAIFYLHRDYLGSILAISDHTGEAVEKRHFDPWGNLVKIVGAGDLESPVADGLKFLDRGYTSHEHLQEVRLIHMNGRLYDPALRGFLMPDNFVQDPENTQNYNRYSYVMNNPLRYSDPSGEMAEAIVASIIGTAVAVTSYLVSNYVTDQPINFGGVVKSAVVGGISASITYGIGCIGQYLSNNYDVVVAAAATAALHGAFQGTMTSISGGTFWSGFAAGAVSSLAASAWSYDGNGSEAGLGWADTARSSTAGMIAFGTVVGGASAELTGGNFWVGAASGLMVSGLNHAMHPMQGEISEDQENPYKRYFAGKLDEVRRVPKTIRQYISRKAYAGLRDSFNASENIASDMEILGIAYAYNTGGESLILTKMGGYFNLFGTLGNVSMDLYEENYFSASYRGVKYFATLGLGKAVTKYIPGYDKIIIQLHLQFYERFVAPRMEQNLKLNLPNQLKN